MGKNVTQRIIPVLSIFLFSWIHPAHGETDPRLRLVHRAVQLVNNSVQSQQESQVTFSPKTGIELIAVASAPTYPGDSRPLQSTGFAILGKTAYVSYMMADELVHGAIDILDLADAAAPRIIQTLLFEQDEFTAIEARGAYLFAVGATSRGEGGAILVVIDVSHPESPAILGRISLAGHTATSIALVGGQALISSGDNGGVSRVDVSNPSHPVISGFLSLENTLDATEHEGGLHVLGGSQATDLFSAVGAGLNFLSRVSQNPTGAPGKLRAEGRHLYTNAGKTGFHIYDVSQAGAAKDVFQGDLPGTGNGIDVIPGYGFLAQGEAGVHVVDLADRSHPFDLGSIDFGDDRGSANQVRVGHLGGKSVVLLGDGLGGFKILGFSSSFSLEATLRHCLFGDDHLDGTRELRGEYPVRIPAELQVTEGNAGKGQATLTFGNVECVYRGASDCPSPVPLTESWERGLKFKLESCSNGAKAGETVLTGTQVKLRIDQSPWLFAWTTRAEAEILLQFDTSGGN